MFFDGPGGSQMPAEVIDAMVAYMRGSNANLGGAFRTSAESDAVLERARAAAADFTGSEPEEIAFGANMTTLNFQLAHAVARTLEPGDEIVVTDLDHDANVSPWLLVAADHDLVVREAPIRAGDGTLDDDALEALLGERTRVVAFTLASNALGTITDAARMAAAAARVGALAWADAVHLAPHRRLRRAELGIHVLLCSPYKFFGPHLGVAAIERGLAETLPADRVRPAEEWPPGHRFETGTQSHEAIAGTAAAVEYLRSLGRRRPRRGVRADPRPRGGAVAPLPRGGAAAVPGLDLYGIADPGTGGGAHSHVLLQPRRPRAARACGGARRARHLRVGRRLLRAGADARARAVGARRGPRRLPPLHDGGRGGPAAHGADRALRLRQVA